MKNIRRILLVVFAVLSCSYSVSAQIEDIQVGTNIRKMLVYAPEDLKQNSPLLLSLHGMNQDIAYQQNQTKWELVANEHGFVVVYPAGINNSWDIRGMRDIDFILAIIDEMYDRYGIDRDRVYLSGFSMGGMMTYHAATKIADKIAAFAPVSGYLMGGPNTNSSRPIPIIHTHGTTDDVVGYGGVQRCMDAWIARNNCPTTAVVTKPYPASKPNSNASKHYWGPGTDSVEVVLLSLSGKGHWHSNEPNGVHTSQEIWNFCKKFTLAYGIPKLEMATVDNTDPHQILASFTLPIKESDNLEGFVVKVDGQVVEVEDVLLSNSNLITIRLTDNILNSNEILLSYNNGNILSTYEKNLIEFNDIYVENLLPGAPPRIVELYISENGENLIAKFNKKMQLPENRSTLAIGAEYQGSLEVTIGDCTFYKNDSSIIAFHLEQKVFADYVLLLTYTGDNVVSADNSLLKDFTDYEIVNKSKGLPVHVVSGILETNAIAIALDFSKPIAMKNAQLEHFTFKVNGESISIKEIFTLNNTVRFMLSNNLYHGNSIKVSYTPGDITSADKGDLESFTDFVVENPLEEPAWYQIPGKIEAEDFALQFGTDTEPVSDEGGGLNVGWTDPGDWLVYAIENNTNSTEFEISFRIAAESTGARFDYYLNDEKLDFLNVPGTGGWQKWQTVVKKITIPTGKHYLKFLVVTGGFNINYFIMQESLGINDQNFETFKIFPNPANDYIIISSNEFQYDKIEIYDLAGKLVLSKQLTYLPELHLPIALANGVYSVKLSNKNECFSSRIVIRKDK